MRHGHIRDVGASAKPDADLPGCNADDEGENDRGLTARFKQVHAAELAVEPNFQILRRYRRPLLLRLEHAHRHVHRAPRLDSRRSLNLRIGITQRSLRSGSAI